MCYNHSVKKFNPKNGESYDKIAQHFGVDRELIRKIDLGFYGTGYIESKHI
jgi:hypothetical protein